MGRSNLLKKSIGLAVILVLIAVAILITRSIQEKRLSQDTEKGTGGNPPVANQPANEPEIGFKPSYKEAATPLSQVPNYGAIKAKYGLTLSPAQEKFLDDNRFLLVDAGQSPFFKSGFNFDQWLVDSDSLGGGSIYNRKPEDAVLITPDTMLHAYHKYFELTLEQLEQHELSQALGDFLIDLHSNLARAVKESEGLAKDRYQNLEAQIVLARVLFENKNRAKPSYFASPAEEQKYLDQDETADSLTNAEKILARYSGDLRPELAAAVSQDLAEIYAAKNIGASPLFRQYDDQIKTDYTQFTPRSHYAKNSALRAYFRTMIYLGRSSYLLNSDLALTDTGLLAKQMATKSQSGRTPLASWKRVSAVTGFYTGVSDDISYDEWLAFANKILGEDIGSDATLTAPENIAKLKAALSQLRKPRILSDVIVDENIAARDKDSLLEQSLSFRVFGQRFSFDAWILNDLTAGQEKTETRLPSTPSALFVPAVFGDSQARDYSGEFLKRSDNFSQTEVDGFLVKLGKKREDIRKISASEWLSSLGGSWLYVLGALTHDYGSGYPLYMRSRSFLSKQIQSFLGSYAELKHDTLLYAKQSYAELGAGGDNQPLPPIVKGFVEPNLEFWNRFNALIGRTEELFADNNLFQDQGARDRLRQFRDISAFCSSIAEKELRSQAITDDEYEKLRTLKLAFMAQPFEAVDPTKISGQTALIADVHTDAVKDQILYEATARPYLMLVIVSNEDSPRVAVGLVYNHYEFTDKIDSRLTDEIWRNRVYQESGSLPEKNFWYQTLRAD